MKNRKLLRVTAWLVVLVLLYAMGPAPDNPTYDNDLPSVPGDAGALEEYISRQETQHVLKPDNEARIVWFDSAHRKTDYAVVYLHGFSASQKEGDPVHVRFAQQFGCNLFLSRLHQHGIDTTDALYHFSAQGVWESAKQALMIGEQLGEKVILMGTSTGSTLALMLAARYPEKVHALINLSPNIAINDPAAFLLNDPWGLYIARMVMGGKYRDTGATGEDTKYWNSKYRLESLVQLQELLETTMVDSTFRKVTQPSLTLFYYRSEEEQDPQVKVSAMLDMHAALATPDSLKVAKAIPDAGAHVIGCYLTSSDVEGVYQEIESFARSRLRLSPVAASYAKVLSSVRRNGP